MPITLNGFDPSVTFAENALNAAPRILDGDVVLGFTGSGVVPTLLTVTGLLPDDVVRIANTGIGLPGDVTFDGRNITLGTGTVFGVASGGFGTTFTVALQNLAGPNLFVLERIVEALVFANDSDTPVTSRVLTLSLTDQVSGAVTRSSITVTITPENDAPSLEVTRGPSSFPENLTPTLAVAAARDADGPSPVALRLTGPDAALFVIDPAGFIHFDFAGPAPDFETPLDANGDNVYEVTVVADDGLASVAESISVTIEDWLEPPSLVDLAPVTAFTERQVKAGPRLLDPDVKAVLGDRVPQVVVAVSGLLAEDRVTLLPEGNGPGQVGFDGAAIRFGGVVVGSATGGIGGPFVVTLDSNPTSALLDAVVERLAFANASETPTLARTLSIGIGTESGGAGVEITVIVAPENAPPTGPVRVTLAAAPEDAPRTITQAELLAGWTDAESSALSVSGLTLLSPGGTLAPAAGGGWAYTPGPDDQTGAVFAFTVTDGTDSVAATATLDLTPVNDAPVGAVAVSAIAGILVADAGGLTDADGMGPVSILWQAQAAGGGWTNIAGATRPAFAPPAADGDPVQALRALARFTDGGGTTERVASATVRLGGTGADSVAGDGGRNLVLGQGGNDTLSGAAGDDRLLGGTGDDLLIGGKGRDSLEGGEGADAFRFLGRSDGADLVLDFVPGLDRIELLGSGFGGLPPGPLAAARFVAGGAATGSGPQVLYDATTGVLAFDRDGTGARAPVTIAVLDGAPALTLADILVIA